MGYELTITAQVAAVRNTLGLPLMASRHSPFRPLPDETAPTLSISTSAMAGAVAHYPFNGTVLQTQDFGFYGAKQSTIKPRSTSFPGTITATAPSATADTLGAPPLTTVFNYVGDGTLDLIRYPDSSALDLYIDDKFLCSVTPAVRTETAQAGAASTITFDAGASGTNSFYNNCYVTITSGTGAGQTRQISGYVGSTKVATVSPNWTTAPDNTSAFTISQTPIGFVLPSVSGSLSYLKIVLPTATPVETILRKITVVSTSFSGVNIGPNDTIWPGPPDGQIPIVYEADSIWAGTAAPLAVPALAAQLSMQLGYQMINLSSGSTGMWTRGTQKLNFLNRIAPPDEAWTVGMPANNGASGGTWKIAITYNGVTATTGNLAYNTNAATIETALNALTFGGFDPATGVSWVGPTGQGCFCVARGDFVNTPYIIIANGMVGATISLDLSGLTGSPVMPIGAYLGDLAINLPLDSYSSALPFILIVAGSGNDTSATGYTDAALQANAITIAQAINSKFPSAIPIFVGIITNTDGTAGNNVISAADVAHNAAILAGAQLLPKINGQVPFIDTYAAGVGKNSWMAPATMKSLIFPGHPTGIGAGMLAARMAQRLLGLFRGQADGATP